MSIVENKINGVFITETQQKLTVLWKVLHQMVQGCNMKFNEYKCQVMHS